MTSGPGLALLFTVLVWWLSTGIVLILCALPRRTFRWSFAAGSAVLALALYGTVESAHMAGAAGAYLAFISALGVWGWLEMSFLMGFVTGPRKTACPPGIEGWRRFRLACAALLYHELAIAAAGAVMVGLTWGAPNQTGSEAFLILMAMRISAKLNIFLGVPNLTEEFLPQRLAYLKSYFRKSPANPLFPVSVFAAAIMAAALARQAFPSGGGSAVQSVGAMLLLALVSLAILEHLFMVTPLPDASLWLWAMPARPVRARPVPARPVPARPAPARSALATRPRATEKPLP